MPGRVTLKDIAQACGVHVSTVSRALDPNTSHPVRADMAERIRRVSRELEYRPNAYAYSLRTRRTRIVGVVVPDITDPVFPPIIKGLEDALHKRGYVAILASNAGDLQREAEITAIMRSRQVDGLILASVLRHDDVASKLSADGIPVVTLSREVEDAQVASVVSDEDAGIRQVVEHLGALGHSRIAMLGGPRTLSTGNNRFEAFRRHSAQFVGGAEECLVAFAEAYNEAEGERCAEQLLASGAEITALVCANDRLAIGAITALRRAGLSCPEDISVTGYNDMPLVDRLSPPLTTVRIQQYRVGFAAGELLVDLVETEPERRRPHHVVLPVQLVVRGSTSPAAGRTAVPTEAGKKTLALP